MHPDLDTECQEKGRLEKTSNNVRGLETMTDIRKLKKMDSFNRRLMAGMMMKVSREDNKSSLFTCFYSLQITNAWGQGYHSEVCRHAEGMGEQEPFNIQQRTNAKPCSWGGINNTGWGD